MKIDDKLEELERPPNDAQHCPAVTLQKHRAHTHTEGQLAFETKALNKLVQFNPVESNLTKSQNPTKTKQHILEYIWIKPNADQIYDLCVDVRFHPFFRCTAGDCGTPPKCRA